MNKIIIWNELTAEQRNKILTDHLTWLESDGSKGRWAYLSRAYLSRADLRGADLRRAYLEIDGEKLKVNAVYQCGPQGSRGAMLVSMLLSDGKVYFGNLMGNLQRAWQAKLMSDGMSEEVLKRMP